MPNDLTCTGITPRSHSYTIALAATTRKPNRAYHPSFHACWRLWGAPSGSHVMKIKSVERPPVKPTWRHSADAGARGGHCGERANVLQVLVGELVESSPRQVLGWRVRCEGEREKAPHAGAPEAASAAQPRACKALSLSSLGRAAACGESRKHVAPGSNANCQAWATRSKQVTKLLQSMTPACTSPDSSSDWAHMQSGNEARPMGNLEAT